MIDLTHVDIFDIIGHEYTRKASTNGGEFVGKCPKCGGTDRFRVWPAPADGSNPAFWCRQCDFKGDALTYLQTIDNLTFSEALAKLGVQSSVNGSTPETPTLAGYATKHGIDGSDLEKCGWEQVEYKGRPALQFTTGGGKRWRFLDGEKPKYISEPGFKRAWYGLNDKVIELARSENSPLFLCNGEISTIAARVWKVPAITMAGGGENRLPDDLLKELYDKWDGLIAIAMDCDEAGRAAASKLQAQLGERGVVIDLGLPDAGDLADFVKLYMGESLNKLKGLIPAPVNRAMDNREAAELVLASLDLNTPVSGKPITMPFKIYHQLDGYAEVCMPGKITGIAAMSSHGKTSWMNTAIDTLMRDGEHGMGIMPEFNAKEYAWDRIQRYTGRDGEPFVTSTMMMKYEQYKYDYQNRVPDGRRRGLRLNDGQLQAAARVLKMSQSWPGSFKLVPMLTTLDDALMIMGAEITARRNTAQPISYVAFDYAQILKAGKLEDDDNSYEAVLGMIKLFVMRHEVHGFVASQVNKTADRANRDNNRVLTSADMRYIRDDKFNLLITLNPIYDTVSGGWVQVPGTDCIAATANIVKNTKGMKGRIPQMVNFKHQLWLDQTYNTHTIDLNEADDE